MTSLQNFIHSEDAEAAVSRIMSLDGRRLFVQFANKKKKEKRKPIVKVEENAEEESDEDSDEEKPPQYPRIAEVEAQSNCCRYFILNVEHIISFDSENSVVV